MKNKSGSKIVNLFKKIFNVRAWADWDRMKRLTLSIFSSSKRLFIIDEATTKETFLQAQKRLHLSASQLLARQQGLSRLAYLMLVMAIGLLGYAFYQAIYGSIQAMVVSLVVMGIALVLAFRYHFWSFQIRQRKLGCSVREWFRVGILGEKL